MAPKFSALADVEKPPAKKVKILQKQDTEVETSRSVYDNLVKRGYEKDDIDVRVGSDGKTARQAIRLAIHNNHVDPKANTLGPKLYQQIRDAHPRQIDVAGWPVPPEGEVCKDGLWKAFQANNTPVMRHREQFLGEVITLETANLSESIVVAKFFMKLNCKNQSQVTEGLEILEFIARDGISLRFPELFSKIEQHGQEMVKQARKSSQSMQMDIDSWIGRHRSKLDLFFRHDTLDKILAAPLKDFRSVRTELVEVTKKDLGRALFSDAYNSILQQDVGELVRKCAKQDFESKKITDASRKKCMIETTKRVQDLPGIETLTKERKASFSYCGIDLTLPVSSIQGHVAFEYNSRTLSALIASGIVKQLWNESDFHGAENWINDYAKYQVHGNSLPGANLTRELANGYIIAPFTSAKIKDCLNQKHKDFLREDPDGWAITHYFWMANIGAPGANKLVQKVLACLPTEDKYVSPQAAHQNLLKLLETPLYDFQPEDVQNRIKDTTSKVSEIMQGNAPDIADAGVNATSAQLYARFPFFCQVTKDDKNLVGKEAFEELMSKLQDITTLKHMKPYLENRWLGSVSQNEKIMKHKDELLAKELASIG